MLASPGDIMAADPVALHDLKPIAALTQWAEARGYRVREVRWDPVLKQRWAVLESVAHPERPLLAERTDAAVNARTLSESAAVRTPTLPVNELAVRSGETVVLWSAEHNVRMQMAAVVEGNASVGDRVQLRVTGAGANGDAGWQVTGIVRGPGSVEMER